MQSIDTTNVISSLVNSIQEMGVNDEDKLNPDTILFVLEQYFKECDIYTLISYKYWNNSEQTNIIKNITEIKYLFFKLNNILIKNINEMEFNFNILAESVDIYNMITIDKFTKYNNDMKQIYNIICSKFNDVNYCNSSDESNESYDSSIYSDNEDSTESFLKEIENINDSSEEDEEVD